MKRQSMNIPIYKVRGKSGIYALIHRESGMCYVGSSVDIKERMDRHLSDSRNGGNALIHRALRAFGHEAFDFEVLEECEKSKLLLREQFYISLLNAASLDGFNSNNKVKANYGISPSTVTRQRISEAKKESYKNSEIRAKISRALSLRPCLPETREKLRRHHLGKKMSEESIRKAIETKRQKKLAQL